jgi:hypothetical protein
MSGIGRFSSQTPPPPPLFEVEFDYTFDDYREAYAAQQRSLLPPGAFWKTFGGWIAFVVLGSVVYLVLRWSSARPRGAAIPPPPATPPIVATSPGSVLSILLPLLPWVIIGLVVARIIQKATRATGPSGRTYRPPVEQRIDARRPVVTGAISVAIVQAALLFSGAILGHPRAGPNLADVLAAMAPYALGVGVIVGLLTWAAQQQAVRKMWDGQPALHVRKHLVVRDDGFSIGDVSSVTQTRWVAVKRFVETPALFLLMLGDYTFHMVPKRALGATPRAAEEFRVLVRLKVQEPTGAFPVMPAAPVTSSAAAAASAAPLPMPPLQPGGDAAAG